MHITGLLSHLCELEISGGDLHVRQPGELGAVVHDDVQQVFRLLCGDGGQAAEFH